MHSHGQGIVSGIDKVYLVVDVIKDVVLDSGDWKEISTFLFTAYIHPGYTQKVLDRYIEVRVYDPKENRVIDTLYGARLIEEINETDLR